MTKDFNRAILDLIDDIQKQLGKDNAAVQYIRTAVFVKLTRDKTKAFIEKDNGEKKRLNE